MGGKKVFELMLEIGHKSQPLKSKLPNGYTHKWTVFVRGANNSKIEHCIQRVVFQLHDSFPDPQREITEPPFQVKETGYAGFEIPIEIYFKNRERPNHVVFMLDLCLHNDLPLNSSRIEKVKFYNPHREFEKCLVKSGAELLSVTKDKKVRSDSPPAKKQKSSSLIPSKDMSKQAPHQQSHSSQATNHYSNSTPSSTAASQNLHQTNSTTAHPSTNHHRHSKSSQQNHTSYNSHTSNGTSGGGGSHHSSGGGNSSNSHFNNHFSHQNNSNHGPHHTTKTSSQQQASSLPKVKSSSKEFIDVFGAPLVCNNNNSKSHKSTTSKDTSDNHRDVTFTTSERSPLPPIAQSKQPSPQLATSQSHNQSHHHKSHHNSNHHNHNHSKHYHTKPQQELPPPPPQNSQAPVLQKAPQKPAPSLAPVADTDSFHIIQNKISSLADCDKLQKIVDIIEESGEWFNLTPNKFEFDLKRLDKKTMSKIEKCLQH